MIFVDLYSKNDCPLCEEAKIVLEKVRQQIPFVLREIKIAAGEEHFEEYKEMVPVVHINGVMAFRHRINENMLKIKLQQISSEKKAPGHNVEPLDDDEPLGN
jgi:glutaredoxin